MMVVHVPLGERSYDVRIGEASSADTADTLARAFGKTSGAAVLVDATVARVSPHVAPLCDELGKRFSRVERYELPAGEASKTLAQIEHTTEWLAQRGFDRSSVIIGVGGGAATDHAGFAASIYQRGIRFALLPTTLLAMVDASVGGKTAVDLPSGKNLVGAFHQPHAVLADLRFLQTLPAREVAAGLAEVIKCGIIADPQLLDLVEARAGDQLSPETLLPLIAGAVRVKADVVSSDERESGRRAILNFGHTFGHAIEAASAYGLLHGEAVALGMLAALALGAARGVTDPALFARTRALLTKVGLPVDVARRIDDDVLARLSVDKKRASHHLRFVFVRGVGDTQLDDVPLADLRAQIADALARAEAA